MWHQSRSSGGFFLGVSTKCSETGTDGVCSRMKTLLVSVTTRPLYIRQATATTRPFSGPWRELRATRIGQDELQGA